MVEITRAATWDAVRAAHRWQIPARYNMAEDLCEKWARAEPDRVAIVHVAKTERTYTFRNLSRLSAQLANVLSAHGVGRGDRVAILLPQVPETVLTHLAAYRLGAIVLPLFTLFGADALAFRLRDAGAKTVVTDSANLPKLAEIADTLPQLETIWVTDGEGPGASALGPAMERARDTAGIVDTGPDDPALISYTSGTTGPPKGALHAHRVVLGHIPAVQIVHDFWPQPGDRVWTPSDWAWMGGLGNIMLPALRFGVPLIACRFERFDPELAFDFLARHGVSNAFLAPTALRLMQQVTDPHRFAHRLRTVGSGGESLGAQVLDWGRGALGLTINEFYGQTEVNPVLACNASILPVRPGSMGRPIPGTDVVILTPDRRIAAPGTVGEIAVGRGDPSMFLEYWKNPEKTADKFRTAEDGREYLMTGDEGSMDAEGYFWFGSRTDDVITSSGYRIGPTEIEECLNGHPDVAMSACVGIPDPVRTEIVKAYIVPAAGAEPSEALASALIARVRERISPHVAPREIAWVDAMPMTATGKIMRRTLRDRGAG